MERVDRTKRNGRRQTVSAAPRCDHACFAEGCHVDEIRWAFPCFGARSALGRAPERNNGLPCVIESSAVGQSRYRGGRKDNCALGHRAALFVEGPGIKTVMQMQCAAAQQPRYDGQRYAGE